MADKPKKKFFNTTVGRILKGAVATVAPQLVSSLEGVGSIGEAVQVIKQSEIPVEDKIALYESIATTQQVEDQEVTKRAQADAMGDSWLSKNVRPISYFFFIGLFSFGMLADSFDDIPFNMTTAQLGVIESVLWVMTGFYFGGRSVEKVVHAYKKVQ